MVENNNRHSKLVNYGKTPFKDIINTEDLCWQLNKREKFAVSLRKEKKKQIIAKKRANLAQKTPLINLEQFDDLHPAFSDRFTTIVSLPALFALPFPLIRIGRQATFNNENLGQQDLRMARNKQYFSRSPQSTELHK